MVMGQIAKIDYFEENAFKNEKATAGEAKAWVDANLKKETYKLDERTCKIDVTQNNSTVTKDLDKEGGMETFKALINNGYVVDEFRKSNALLLLGDIVDVGARNLIIEGKLESKELWINRLKCGWNLFFRNLEKFNAARIVPLDFNNPATSAYKIMVSGETDVILGNSAHEVDLAEVKKIYQEITKKGVESNFYDYNVIHFTPYDKLNWDINYTSPKLSTFTYEKSKYTVQFLDFNSDILYCLTPTIEEYKKCTDEKKQSSPLEYKELLDYIEKVEMAIRTMKADRPGTQEKVWRVMRSVQSPLNVQDGDPKFYYQDYKNNGKTINLFKAMKEMGVEIFISSAMKNAQVISLPYSVEHKFKEMEKCSDKEYQIFGCYETKPGKFDMNPVGSRQCNDKLEYSLPVRDLTDTASTTTMLHVFNIGNSGVDVGKIRGGKMTGGSLIWSRAEEKNNGFLQVHFNKMKAEIKFYEVDGETKSLNIVAKFEVSGSSMPGNSYMQKFLDDKCVDNSKPGQRRRR